ncbi:vacuolar protein sorting-associated protein 28 homolog 2, partial [Tanacetum coccineum]
VPATVEHRAAATAFGLTSLAAIVAECVNAMDTLKINMTIVDQVFPLLSDLSGSLNKLLSM